VASGGSLVAHLGATARKCLKVQSLNVVSMATRPRLPEVSERLKVYCYHGDDLGTIHGNPTTHYGARLHDLQPGPRPR
jgi:hypothetical protein